MDQPVVDFETLPIIAGSGLSPEPVGVSILVPGEDNVYIGWGHPGPNPNTWEDGRRALFQVWEHRPVFHNCKFDIGVAVTHMGLPWPDEYDDTMFQTYLVEPLATHVSLKTTAHRLLGMPPDEQDAVFAWLKANFKGPFLPDHKQVTKANFGAYIGYAPYGIVAPYAKGDTARTRGLHGLLRPKVAAMGMDAAYQRELSIARIGYEMERVGVRVDREALQRDYEKYDLAKREAERVVQGFVGDIDLTKRGALGVALVEGDHVDVLPKTPTGKVSTSKANLMEHVSDPKLTQALRHWGVLQTTGAFFNNWIRFSERDGHVHPSWNQVKAEKHGARTGRFSCSEPNFQNVPTEFDDDVLDGLDLPFMRQYILPDCGQIIVPADYNGQEMRIMAHYAEGRAMAIYREDPTADFHAVASALIKQYTGLVVPRKMCKIVGFSLIYGSGVATLARQLGVPPDKAKKIRDAYFKAIPGLQEFIWLFRRRQSVKTWGGRILPAEAPREVDGEWREFYYKLCNYLIQGSAADQTKEALVRYDSAALSGRMLMTVHDELVISTPVEHAAEEVEILKWSMEEMPGWDTPFVAEVEQGHNWHQLERFVYGY